MSYLKSKYSKAKKCLRKKGSVVACWLIEDQILKVGIRRNTRQLVLTKHTEIGGKRLYIMTRDNEWKSYICTVKQWYVVTCFTRVIYIYANSPGLSGSLPLSRTGDQNSRIRGSLDQLPTKNYNLVSVCSKISKSSGFLCLYYGFWLHFLAWCTLFVANKKRRKISCLKSLIDRSTFFPRSWSVGGGGGGTGPEKSLKIWDLQRLASLNMGIINWTENVNWLW